MNLTFTSLFASMRRIGPSFWLAVSVLLSSVFVFLFSLFVTTKLGVPLTMTLLSEGLPFLIVAICFEKNIALTRAVLSHAVEHGRSSNKDAEKSKKSDGSLRLMQYAIQVAIKEKGFEIIKGYTREIGILIVGAVSGAQGGLQQFCFLVAWILFFDCIVQFSFYTAIICMKLETNRIKRHAEIRKALEDEGVDGKVAENVAQSNDWLSADGKDQPGTTVFGQHIKITYIPRFKLVMVFGFFLINAFNLCTIHFRNESSSSSTSGWVRGFGRVAAPPPLDLFKVASHGLDAMPTVAKSNGLETVVTVLTSIRYELEFSFVHYDLPQRITKGYEDTFGNLGGYGVGGRMVGGVLKSLEDPMLSKWIVVDLALSVAFIGCVYSAATAGIKDPNDPNHAIDRQELAQAQKFNEAEPAIWRENTRPQAPLGPLTPASTDDEGDIAMQGDTTIAPIPDSYHHA